MELTKEQIIDRIEAFTMHASRVQELKDELLEIKMVGTEKELAQRETRTNEIMEEIRTIYKEHMLVIMKEMTDYVIAHRQEIEEIIEQYEGEDFYAIVEGLLLNAQQERLQKEAEQQGYLTIESFLI